ncbi:hypothetical protein Tco_0135233 [Tanacetum coccineum]
MSQKGDSGDEANEQGDDKADEQNAKPADKEKDDEEMTVAGHVNVKQEGAVTALEKDVKELKDVDNSSKVISTIQSDVLKIVKEYLGSSMDDAMHKVIQKNVADIIKEYSVPAKTVERLKQQYAPQKSVEDIQEIKMDHARKQQVPKETFTSSDTTALEEYDQKTNLFETMTKSKSFNKSLKQRALYHALMESILEDEDVMEEGVVDNLKKRKLDDADKDEGPFAGSD